MGDYPQKVLDVLGDRSERAYMQITKKYEYSWRNGAWLKVTIGVIEDDYDVPEGGKTWVFGPDYTWEFGFPAEHGETRLDWKRYIGREGIYDDIDKYVRRLLQREGYNAEAMTRRIDEVRRRDSKGNDDA